MNIVCINAVICRHNLQGCSVDWRDLRIALALERHRTLSGAGRSLRMDPTTVSRRIAALEEALGQVLFIREAGTWRTTDVGKRVVERAASMAREARALKHDVDAASDRVTGLVRITTLDYVASWFLVPHFKTLREQHPNLSVQLMCTPQMLDLEAGQADVAIRIARPREPRLRTRRLCELHLGLYGERGYVERHGFNPLLPDARPDLVVPGPDERLLEVRWLRAYLPEGRMSLSTISLNVLFDMVVAGAGLGILSTVAADAHPDLIRLDSGMPPLQRSLWRVAPERLSDAPRIRAVLNWLDDIVSAGPPGAASPRPLR